MAHKVINKFKDKEDNNTIYEVGDEYPKGNYKPTKKRIEELSVKHPQYKTVFIKESDEEKKPTVKKQPKDSKSKE